MPENNSTAPKLQDLAKRLALVENQLAAMASGARTVTDPESAQFDIVSIDGKTIEPEVEGEARFSWKLIVRCESDGPLRVDAHIQLVDMDSFALFEHTARGLLLLRGERQKFTGIVSLPASTEERVMGVKASLS